MKAILTAMTLLTSFHRGDVGRQLIYNQMLLLSKKIGENLS